MLVDQSPIGRTPRSNPVTYIKVYDAIREVFSQTRDAQAQGLRPLALLLQRARRALRRLPGRRHGDGRDAVPRRRRAGLRGVQGHALQAAGSGRALPRQEHQRRAQHDRARGDDLLPRHGTRSPTACACSTTSDSATCGSASRRRRSPAARRSASSSPRYLSKRTGARTLYIFDEPTTGLHFDDINKLLAAFRTLVEAGGSLLVIEHNLDVIKTADYLIDLGPEGGDAGGHVVATGTPEEIMRVPESHTGRFLAAHLARSNGHRKAAD